MLEALLNFLFSPVKSFKKEGVSNSVLEDLKASPNFISKEDSIHEKVNKEKTEFVIPKGKKITMRSPDIPHLEFRLVEWVRQVGEVVAPNEVICILENEHLTMEYESQFHCKIFYTEPINTVIKHGDRVCIIEEI